MRTHGWTLLAAMRRRMLWSGTLVVCLVLAVGAGPALADPPVCGDGKCTGQESTTCPADCGGGGGRDDEFSVDVTFRDFECDTSRPDRDHFCSDDGTPYEDGVDQVTAGGDKFRFGFRLRHGPRKFFLDFSDRDGDPDGEPDGEPDNCVSGMGTCDVTPLLMGGTEGAGLTSGSAGGPSEGVFTFGEASSLLDMVVGEMKDRNFWIKFTDFNFSDGDGDHWTLSFDPTSSGRNACPDTTLVPVTRTSDTTWDFVATNQSACLQRRVGGRGPTISHGRYRLPFKLTVTLQP